jgi:hypothetical protein
LEKSSEKLFQFLCIKLLSYSSFFPIFKKSFQFLYIKYSIYTSFLLCVKLCKALYYKQYKHFLAEYIIYIFYTLYIYIFINKYPYIYFSDMLRSKICLFRNIISHKITTWLRKNTISKRKKMKFTYRILFTFYGNYIILNLSKSILFDKYNFIKF